MLKMVGKLRLKVAAMMFGCCPRWSKSKMRARVCTRAAVAPRRKIVFKERSSVSESLIDCAVLAMTKRYGKQEHLSNNFDYRALGSLVVKADDFSRALTTQHTSSLNDY